MRLDIAIEADIHLDPPIFISRYLEPECPVLVRGVGLEAWSNFDVTQIKEYFGVEAHRRPGWFDAALAENLPLPKIVETALGHEELSWRARPMRVWLQPAGHRTLAHYDNHSLHGFNLQVAGRKRWRLISPHTPPRMAPFQFIALAVDDHPLNRTRCDLYEFDTEPGDLVFLPRYWCHETEALGPVNFNVNWVCTPRNPTDSPVGLRERELLRLRTMFPILEKYMLEVFEGYDDKDTLMSAYMAGVSNRRALRRFIRELSNLPLTLWLVRDLRERIRALEDNNFRVDASATSNARAGER